MAEITEKRKKFSIIDFIKNLTSKKVKWESYSELEKKDFQPFMLNKWLSMNYDLVEFINSIQKYISTLDKAEFYKLYFNILPKEPIYIQYIKGKSQDKYNPNLIELLSKYFECSKEEIEDYLKIYFKTDAGIEEIKNIVAKYGKSEKEINKMIAV